MNATVVVLLSLSGALLPLSRVFSLTSLEGTPPNVILCAVLSWVCYRVTNE